MLLAGIGLLLAAIVMLFNNVIWYYGWGGGVIFILFGLFGDQSSPETAPRKISQKVKAKTSGDFDYVGQVLSSLNEIQGEWSSKKEIASMRERILKLKNMATTRIKYTFGNSLITYFQVSFTKSKDAYMITFEGEGEQSTELFENTFAKFVEV